MSIPFFTSRVKRILVNVLCIAGLIFLIASSGSGCTVESTTTTITTTTTATATITSTPPPTENITCPELIFNDPEFAFELRRTLSGVYTGEADLGECLYTASRITDGDLESWYREWYATAEHFKQAGDESLANGHIVSAREAYYRASTYYRTAEFFLHGNPADPRILETWGKSRDTFVAAASRDRVPFEVVEIPYENTTLPGYFYSVDASVQPRPLLIVQTGFDGCQEELHPYAMEGIKRGYNVLTFEGPGQGAVIRLQHLPFRPDWENVVTPVVDYAINRPDVDEDRIALWGISLGGYLAPRAAAYEHRIAAIIADAGVYDVGLNLWHGAQEVGGELAKMSRQEFKEYLLTNPPEFNDAMESVMQHSTSERWFNEQGMYVFNTTSIALFWAKYMDFTLEGSVEMISCPVLVAYATNDHFDPKGEQAKLLYDHIKSEKELMEFTEEYETDYHCQMGAFAQAFAKKFDWLDETLSISC
ncbi:MAG: alpha/beta fold hydrolase [Dehalococcoidales bacterium]|nr:alpha/beta fold hydrolase [Dehalococcoidales bacterium]